MSTSNPRVDRLTAKILAKIKSGHIKMVVDPTTGKTTLVRAK